MLDYDKLYKTLEGWNSESDNYLGVLFANIYKQIPTCYYATFNKDHQLLIEPYVNKTSYYNSDDELDNEDFINMDFISDRDLLNFFKNDRDNFEIVNYSNTEYLVLGKKIAFLTRMIINDTGDTSLSKNQIMYIDLNDHGLEILEYIKPAFIKNKRKNNIEFGIAAVDITGGIYTTYYNFKEVPINIEDNYNDDIPYTQMIDILDNQNKSSLLLFYGDPGTGKSTMIKHLIGKLPNKAFVFVDGSLLANVQQDKLMSYFLENQDTVFIFEDCEKILMDRDHNYNPTMSILLNLTDGIISDVLHIKIICTFNTALRNIDKALLRKGRLSLKYEFGKLAKEKVQKLLNDDTINSDMTLADVYYYKEENDYSKKATTRIGF